MAGTKITDTALVHLSGLTNLSRGLALDSCDIDGSGLEHLTGLVKLRTLSLRKTRVTNGALVQLTQLRTLDLSQAVEAAADHFRGLGPGRPLILLGLGPGATLALIQAAAIQAHAVIPLEPVLKGK